VEDGMSVESKEELRRLRDEKIRKKFERILSLLSEKERDLEKSVENLEEKLVAKRFEEEILAKQSVVAGLAVRKVALERKLKELENKFVLEGEAVKQTEETNALPIVVHVPKLDLETRERIREAVKEPEKKRFWKFSS